jgi:hypothetical protein
MATAPFRPDVRDSIEQAGNDMHRMASDMKHTVVLTRAMIESTRVCMLEADRVLKHWWS